VSILFKNSCFVHIPRTGGTWLQNAVLRADVWCRILKGDIDSHLPYRELPPVWRSRPYSFSFVRKPLSWMRSRWTHLREHEMLGDYRHYGIHRLFDELATESFEETVRAILDKRPGLVGNTYEEMLDGVETVYRMESLHTRFFLDFSRMESLSLQQLLTMRAEQACNGTSTLPQYEESLQLPASLEMEFAESESKAITIWQLAK
jgi:hypothetical protein